MLVGEGGGVANTRMYARAHTACLHVHTYYTCAYAAHNTCIALTHACMRAGKYTPGGVTPYGPRSALFNYDRRNKVLPLVSLLQAIGQERQKTPVQVRVDSLMHAASAQPPKRVLHPGPGKRCQFTGSSGKGSKTACALVLPGTQACRAPGPPHSLLRV